jgi:hypothetical protein
VGERIPASVRVVLALHLSPGLTAKGLALACGVQTRTAWIVLRRLRRGGVVTCSGRGAGWNLATSGNLPGLKVNIGQNGRVPPGGRSV